MKFYNFWIKHGGWQIEPDILKQEYYDNNRNIYIYMYVYHYIQIFNISYQKVSSKTMHSNLLAS